MKYQRIILLIIITIATFNSCKKGDTGPVGPTGPTGASGPSAKRYDFQFYFSTASNHPFYALPNLLEAGDVIMLFVGTNQFSASPYDFLSPLPYKGYAMGQNIDMTFQGTSSTIFIDNTTSIPSTLYSFRAVVIKTSARVANPNVDLNNYEEVKKAFNLPD